MNKRIILLGLVLATALTGSAIALRAQLASDSAPNALLPCERNDALFPLKNEIDDTRGVAEYWRDTYHATVGSIIDAHRDQVSAPLLCTEYPRRDASPALRGLASALEPWKGKEITESDMDAVLIEYLRTYECSLLERENALTAQVAGESGQDGIGIDTLLKRTDADQTIITQEQTVARSALERTLRYLGGEDRLEPLTVSFQCLERASLDIRNILALSSDASACLTRIQDARGTLRTLAP